MLSVVEERRNAKIEEAIKAAKARYEAMSPVERAIHDMEQKRSGCIGLSDFDIPLEEITRRIDAMPEFVLLAEVKRLRALHPNS